MAKPILILFLLAVGLFACEKSQVNRIMGAEDGLQATWELRSIQAGMTPVKEYPPGNGYLLTLDGTNFKEYTKDSIYRAGTYRYLGKDSTTSATCPHNGMPGDVLDRIEWTPDLADMKRFFVLEADTLTFYSGCYAYDGGYTMRWERLK